MKRLIIIVILTVFTTGMLTGCYDNREVDDLAYVIAIGMDKGKTNKLKLTLQFAVPKAIGSGGAGGEGRGGGGSGGEEASTFITLETPSFMAGLDLANNVVSRQINISHAKIMVYSKELAEEGIANYLNGFARVRELKPSIYMVVARGSAEEYLKSIKPVLESNAAKYYELIFQAHKYTGFTANTNFFKFYKYAKSSFIKPVATLAGISKNESSDDFNTEASTYREKGREFPLEGDFKAGDTPRTGDIKSEIMGLGIFNGYRMVGELDGEETSYYLMLRGEFKHSTFTLADPLNKNSLVLIDVKQSRRPVHKVDISNGRPRIRCKIKLEGDIQAIQSDINYEKPDKLPVLEKAYEDFIKKGIEKMLKKTAKEFSTDIIGFGAYAMRKFPTWEQWIDYGWHQKYPEAEFNVEVDLKIRRPGLLISSEPLISSKTGKW